jgi:hypothetical protein
MANPVAVYAADPYPPRRVGPGSAQIIEIEAVRARARGAEGARRYDSYSETQDAPASDRTASDRAARYERVRRASYGTPRFASGDDAEEFLAETGRRRAPSNLRFAAQFIAQEMMPPGLNNERMQPAVAAYALAARYGIPGGDPTSHNGQMLSLYA